MGNFAGLMVEGCGHLSYIESHLVNNCLQFNKIPLKTLVFSNKFSQKYEEVSFKIQQHP